MFLDVIPYSTLEEADDYFSTRANSDEWTYATDTQKTQALKSATRLIDRLKFKGVPIVTDQYNRFPRYIPNCSYPTYPPPIPDEVKIATCEIALQLCNGVDIDQEVKS